MSDYPGAISKICYPYYWMTGIWYPGREKVYPPPIPEKKTYHFPTPPPSPIHEKIVLRDPYYDVGWFGFKKRVAKRIN